jgi:hypothetical protein
MGAGEVMAGFVLGGVAIAVLITIGTTLNRWIDYKRRKVEVEAEALTASRQVRDDGYTEQLEERVRVLERIATDRGHDIAHQIEALRDAPQFAATPRQQEAN